jgi:hypothetical protein
LREGDAGTYASPLFVLAFYSRQADNLFMQIRFKHGMTMIAKRAMWGVVS